MPPQAGSFHTEPQPAHASFSRRRLCPQGRNSYALSLLPLGGQSKHPSNLSPKNIFLRAPLRVAPSALLCPRALAHTTRDPSAAGPSPVLHVAFCGPPINKKNAGPRHCAANPQKCRLLAQENARRHAWLTRSCFGRKNLFIDGPRSLLPFFLSPFLQRKRKKKTEANSAGSNTSLGLTSFVLTMYAIGPAPRPLKQR